MCTTVAMWSGRPSTTAVLAAQTTADDADSEPSTAYDDGFGCTHVRPSTIDHRISSALTLLPR